MNQFTVCNWLILNFFIIQLIICGSANAGGKVNNEELYKLLNVSKTANTKEIRIAFKKIALEKHPDKNTGDPNANANFIRINRAYEILKDDDLRKKYDLYGEDGLKDDHNKGQNYQSWNFYKQNFGIYDDDPEVITLTRSDFMQYVESNEDTIWFINFYSTQCSHCHELAPTWRELSKLLDGVVRIGAVNCMDDWQLCNQQQIQAFPSLIMYPSRQRFQQEKTIENLLYFAFSFTKGELINLNTFNSMQVKNNLPWLISFCLKSSDDEEEQEAEDLNYELNCLDDSIKKKLSIMLNKLVNVGSIDCDSVNDVKCKHLKPSRSNPIAFYLNIEENTNIKYITTTDYKQINQIVLSYLPDIEFLDENKFSSILDNLKYRTGLEKPWLIQFVNDFQQNQDIELRKLPSLLKPNFNAGRVDCASLKDPSECFTRFQIHKYPTFILFKSAAFLSDIQVDVLTDTWYEINYNSRISSQDLSAFVKENFHTSVRTLTKFNPDIISNDFGSKNGYFIDFFSPMCPPCMNMLPEFRKASKLTGSKLFQFGTIDCTVNQQLCEKYNVRSYPTTVLFNNSTPYSYSGQHSAEEISEFIQDTLNPSVVTLNYELFHELVAKKTVGKLWLVDFFASWCGPCQQLAPEWRKLAKKFDKNLVLVGQVDCVVEQRLCSEQGITSYPNIRAYPSNSKGILNHQQYQGWMRDSNSLFQWSTDFMPTKTILLDLNKFEKLVLQNDDNEPWLIDFYAPWCGHCNVFAPKFEVIAGKLEGKVKCGKVNCQDQQFLCQKVGLQAYPSIMFYPITKSSISNWNIGESIFQYEVDSILNVVNDKLHSYGYNKLNTAHVKTEL